MSIYLFGNCKNKINKKQHRSEDHKAVCAYFNSKFCLEKRGIIYLIMVCLHENKHVIESNRLHVSESNHKIYVCSEWRVIAISVGFHSQLILMDDVGIPITTGMGQINLEYWISYLMTRFIVHY